MKKVLSFTLASLALSVFVSPIYAEFGGSVRGDVGMLGNQVPAFMVETGIAPTTGVNLVTDLSRRKEGQWDFTGRLFIYATCAPCPMYIAASWQGSNHRVHSCFDTVEEADVQAIIPLRIVDNQNTQIVQIPIGGISNGSPVLSKVEVKNKFSKAKLGVGFDLIKTCCFNVTMEVGGNYLDAHLNTNQTITITQTVAAGANCLQIAPGLVPICSPLAGGLPFDFVIHNDTWQKTDGVGLYANFKAEYKFPATCLGNCFSIYGKAEVADIIGRQKYTNEICYLDEFTQSHVAIVPPEVFRFTDHVCNRYNNVIEVDLEAALVYSPCFKCWNNLNLSFALGVRTDSFVNLFAEPIEYKNVTYLSLTRPTVFLEVGIKV